MIVVDSSGWIEIFTDGPLRRDFRSWIDQADEVLVPTLVVYEVYKVIRRGASEDEADQAIARLRQCTVVPLDDALAVEAADFSLQRGLAMADAVVYATAQAQGVPLVTSDRHFQGLPGVEYIPSPAE